MCSAPAPHPSLKNSDQALALPGGAFEESHVLPVIIGGGVTNIGLAGGGIGWLTRASCARPGPSATMRHLSPATIH